jgi:transcriptional activator SPT7
MLTMHQLYQNQFPKYDPQPLVEADIETHVVSDDGPIMAEEVCRAAFQRTIGKIFYHTGFEDFQPSALDAATDLAAEYFQQLTRTFMHYKEAPKLKSAAETTDERGSALEYQKRYSIEEALLHSLNENSMDIESLEIFVKDDIERLGQKLGVMHERMKGHLADLLVRYLVFHLDLDILTRDSVLRLILPLVPMVLVPLTTIATNSLAEILQRTLAKISSVSKNLA